MRKWRFELTRRKAKWWRLEKEIPQMDARREYNQAGEPIKYLGIELTRTLQWSKYIKRIIAKARRNMTQALAMGISGGFMTVRLANIIWMSLVRSIIEYGCEIWGEKEYIEFEKLQLEMGKRILRCGSRTTDEVVRGELGWERQKARRDEMRLRYWAKI